MMGEACINLTLGPSEFFFLSLSFFFFFDILFYFTIYISEFLEGSIKVEDFWELRQVMNTLKSSMTRLIKESWQYVDKKMIM